jgi:hypothetical protein
MGIQPKADITCLWKRSDGSVCLLSRRGGSLVLVVESGAGRVLKEQEVESPREAMEMAAQWKRGAGRVRTLLSTTVAPSPVPDEPRDRYDGRQSGTFMTSLLNRPGYLVVSGSGLSR